jgi:transcriptional regulator with XRE-family HTH domain
MFSERLSRLRTEKKFTHQDMADRLGITRQAYGNYESEKREPDFKTLRTLSDLFDVSIDYLTGKSDYRNAEELAAKWKEVAQQAQSGQGPGEQAASEGMAFFGGGKNLSPEEVEIAKAAAQAAVEAYRKGKAKRGE